ncbi:Serine acetyltransferase [Sphingobacterium mizutaii]|uniref:Serine acetyltransferase n=2 Tax=Sphingobacterium mizutaii TaxID=1010 RepID=A0AAJ4XD51_9SPHI|nr:serine O-acetyltransferase [Sphingobacterium mizutaii]SDL32067.1 serine O-acetyltransferase [Sphingobacterium mizutaii]SNV54916.1 Serine acetyltransferase [Sphingobacterium mizutaii]
MIMEDFYQHIYEKQQAVQDMPSNKAIAHWAIELLHLLFPERNSRTFNTVQEIEAAFKQAEADLYLLLFKTKACSSCNIKKVSEKFFANLPSIYQRMLTDAEAIMEGDPAAQSLNEVIRTYPGFLAISIYRLANELWIQGIPLIPRILTEHAHSKTGIDIHPGAFIDEYLHIDHGTGIVIGETCRIGKHVKLYQGVTLGALSVEKNMANTQRHPIIEDHVIIYAGATILGGETVVGHHSVIGGNVWLTSSVDPYTTVYHQPNSKFIDSKPLA